MTVRLAMKFTDADDVTPLLTNDEWVFEQKMDGTRALAVLTPSHIRFLHSGGGQLAHSAATQHLPKIKAALSEHLAYLASAHGDDYEIVLDGEIMIRTGQYHLFDMPYARFGSDEVILPTHPFYVRRAALDTLARTLTRPVSVVRQAVGTDAKTTLLTTVQDAGGEGIMAKHLDSRYQPGRRVTTQRKVKFVKTADVIVSAFVRPDDRHGSASLAVWDPAAEELVPVGGCSLIGKAPVKVGDVIEVTYLYWTGSSLYQPRMMRVRDDKPAIDCHLDQFAPYSRDAV